MHVFLNRLVRTSMAVLNVCTFTERGSHTSSSLMSAITPLSPSTPHVVLPSAACFAWDEKLGTSKSTHANTKIRTCIGIDMAIIHRQVAMETEPSHDH